MLLEATRCRVLDFSVWLKKMTIAFLVINLNIQLSLKPIKNEGVSMMNNTKKVEALTKSSRL